LDGLLLVILATYYIFIIKGSLVKSQKIKRQSFTKLIKNSVYGVIYISFWYLVTRADQFVIPVYFNAYSLGVYSAAVKVIEMSNVLIVILQLLVLPRIISILGEDSGSRKMHITIAIYLIAGVLAAGMVQMLAPVLVGILFGSAFVETISILRVYAWSIPGLFVSYLFSVVAMANSTIKPLAVHSVLTAVVMLAGLFYVADKGNMLAVASVSVIVYTISATTLYIMWRKKYI
jgi:O-antigen/teichoic acid export membrane protein